MINASETREEDENFKNAVDMMFEELEEKEPEHFAVICELVQQATHVYWQPTSVFIICFCTQDIKQL